MYPVNHTMLYSLSPWPPTAHHYLGTSPDCREASYSSTHILSSTPLWFCILISIYYYFTKYDKSARKMGPVWPYEHHIPPPSTMYNFPESALDVSRLSLLVCLPHYVYLAAVIWSTFHSYCLDVPFLHQRWLVSYVGA
ncbi:hypothetical protein F4781DRAFT_187748 [Annulohypoxylon bovei var. microspora]|nr:hypothetical protein F4781DRAFT_187748 [Annulohypoxylon bovei var. microspora]